MKTTIRTIALTTICFLAMQTTQAATNHHSGKVSKSSSNKNEEAHWVKGATMDNFVMPVNPMQKPVKAPLV